MDKRMTHLDEDEKNAVQKLINKLKQRYEIEQIILFGSKSRQDYSKYSDVDLLVLTKNKLDAKELDEFFNICSAVNVDHGAAINCLVIYQDDWVKEENINRSLKNNVEKDGVPIAV